MELAIKIIWDKVRLVKKKVFTIFERLKSFMSSFWNCLNFMGICCFSLRFGVNVQNLRCCFRACSQPKFIWIFKFMAFWAHYCHCIDALAYLNRAYFEIKSEKKRIEKNSPTIPLQICSFGSPLNRMNFESAFSHSKQILSFFYSHTNIFLKYSS